ncbi:hypothetical protein D6D01_08126 [Aureobasidium pullulans]|uniref:Uncharacterized protein n=1 Tax=Aureobasidium pullulans TaxID=5580 RepID=A0A4S9KEP6_AURPU|nr:hypothetical protein D6D01_08126 [Aureobasidium pullulans]
MGAERTPTSQRAHLQFFANTFDLAMGYFDIYDDDMISPAPSAAQNDADPTVHNLESEPLSAEACKLESTQEEHDSDIESQSYKESPEYDLVIVNSTELRNRQAIEQEFDAQPITNSGEATLQGEPTVRPWKRWPGYQALRGIVHGNPNAEVGEASNIQKSAPNSAPQQPTDQAIPENSHHAQVREPVTTRDRACDDLAEKTHHHWLSSHRFQALHMKLSRKSSSNSQGDGRKDSLPEENVLEGQSGQDIPKRRMSVRALLGRRDSVNQDQDPKA